jgi:putative transposase
VLTPHPLYEALGTRPQERQQAYRALFRAQLDEAAVADLRQALNQNQPVGNARFLGRIAQRLGERREARPRGRPRGTPGSGEPPAGQGELGV